MTRAVRSAAPVLLAVLLAALLAGCGASAADGERQPAGAGDRRGASTDRSADPTADRRGPLPDGGAASCVETYSPEALRGRAFAFDGVVAEVGPSVTDRGDGADLGLPGVTFEVREWFAGGRGETVTVDLQPAGGLEDPGPAYGVGSRLLVSGEARWGGVPLAAPIAWGCGFTRYHDAATATAWREALAR